MPSAMLQTDFLSWDLNLTMLAQIENRYRFGMGYRVSAVNIDDRVRMSGAMNLLFAMDIINGLELGYTYELPINGLLRESYGSHELFLAYSFNILKPKHTNRYKSIRYL